MIFRTFEVTHVDLFCGSRERVNVDEYERTVVCERYQSVDNREYSFSPEEAP